MKQFNGLTAVIFGGLIFLFSAFLILSPGRNNTGGRGLTGLLPNWVTGVILLAFASWAIVAGIRNLRDHYRDEKARKQNLCSNRGSGIARNRAPGRGLWPQQLFRPKGTTAWISSRPSVSETSTSRTASRWHL
jgi:hypothetical protein